MMELKEKFNFVPVGGNDYIVAIEILEKCIS
jgi:hypothetical protein